MIHAGNELLTKHLLDKAKRSHKIMIWCGIFIYPAFGILDFLLIPDWQLFLTVRLFGTTLLIYLLICDRYFKLSPTWLAHVSCQIVIGSLMWMLGQIEDSQTFAIYTINSCTGYIASALFLFWKPIDSVILLVLNILTFIFFISFSSPLPWFDALVNGAFLLLTIALMSQFYIYYRCLAIMSDFRVQRQLSDLNVELWTKNNQIETQSAEIMKKNEDLQQLNTLKDKLFIIVSHDLRAPLQSLKGVLELINKSATLSADEFVFLTKGIKTRIDLTFSLMENLLFWTRSQMTGFKVKPSSVHITSIATECIGLLHSIAEKKQVTILNKINNDHFANVDTDMLRLVIRNLVMNAIKFSYEGGVVEINSTDRFSEIEIYITDSGVGMSQEEVSNLFGNPSYVSKTGTANEGGTGLGLMLCKEFVEMNNGRLWAVSKAGEGSSFHFTLHPASNDSAIAAVSSSTRASADV